MEKLFRSEAVSKIADALLPVFATLAALAVGALMLLALGANPLEAFGALIEGAFGSQNALADTVVKATPLLLVGLGICISFRGNVINIGGEGQMIIGALMATALGLAFPDWPGFLPQVCSTIRLDPGRRLVGRIWQGTCDTSGSRTSKLVGV